MPTAERSSTHEREWRQHVSREIGTEAIKDTIDLSSSDLSTREVLQSLPEALTPRVEQAVDSCEFESTAEIKGAVKSYYEDHYKAAKLLEQMIEAKPIDPELLVDDATKLQSEQMTQQLQRLAMFGADATDPSGRAKQLHGVGDMLTRELFAESAVGQTTMSEQELALKTGLYRQLEAVGQVEGVLIDGKSDEMLRDSSDIATKKFWEDSRHAGQLLFHNTPFADELATSGFKLQTRSKQEEVSGTYRAATIDSAGWSQSIHFSETFMSDSYKRELNGTRADKVTIGATIAVPLAEVIKTTPYGRLGEYGVIGLKDPTAVAKATINDEAILATKDHWHNAGKVDDAPGKDGLDRTFYADGKDREAGEKYEIDFGSGMASTNGNTSHVIYLQRDIDAAHRKQYMQNATNVDARIDFGSGYGVPQRDILDFDYGRGGLQEMKDVRAVEPGAAFVDPQYAAMSANRLGIIDDRLSRTATEHGSFREGVSPQQQDAELRNAIKTMQKESRDLPQYKDKLVVMLRGGVMAYKPSQ
ncbi:MAG: hypothetical protein EON54_16120 [Alcaligenaceae bacterium]|nr:MAG: hypothetical protein EON54_16120 [Alcaligenaceae bacterium]